MSSRMGYEALKHLLGRLDDLYARTGRPSIAPVKLLE